MRASRVIHVLAAVALMIVLPVGAQERQPSISGLVSTQAPRATDSSERDAMRRRELETRDSQIAAHRRRVEEAVRAAGGQQVTRTKRRGPMSDRGPFHEYNWVFAANLLIGALGGAFAVRMRRARRGEGAAPGWLAFGGCFGIAGALFVFICVWFAFGMLSILSGPSPPGVLFAFTAPVTAIASLGMAFDSGRGRNRPSWME